MRTTIDAAGRVVIPKRIRDLVGLRAGEVELTIDGAAVRVAPVAADAVVDDRGRRVVPPAGAAIDDDLIQALRFADQR
jgi:AbrB family looped-hinge helix DNA binding protein